MNASYGYQENLANLSNRHSHKPDQHTLEYRPKVCLAQKARTTV
jgi:hypothetical protein